MKRKFLVLSFLLFLVLSIFFKDFFLQICHSPKAYLNDNCNTIVATIDNLTIKSNTIDSIASKKIFEIRSLTLDDYLVNLLIKKEAKKHNLKDDVFLKKWIYNKIDITDDDIRVFLNNNPSLSNNFEKADFYLRHIKLENQKRVFFDSVSQFYSINKFIKPEYFKKIDTQKIFGFPLSKTHKESTNVYVISNPHCFACKEVFANIEYLVNKYNNQVNFWFIYLSNYFENDAVAFMAAYKQDRFADFYRKTYQDLSSDIDSDEYLINLAIEMGLNIQEFEKDFNDKASLRYLLETRDFLFKNEIFETPAFIVNKLVLNEHNAINYLENVILEEIGKR